MLRKTGLKKLLFSLIAVCVMVSMLGGVWAAAPSTTGNAGKNVANTYSQKQMYPKQQFETLLTALVKEGKLTQAKTDNILAFLDKMQPVKKPADSADVKKKVKLMKKMSKGGIIALLKEQGIITKEEAAVIKAKMEAVRIAERKAKLDELLGTLIENKVITEEQSKKIAAFIEQKEAERKAEAAKVQNMTVEERKAYFKAQKGTRVDMVTEMVNQGIITETQAKLLGKLMPMGGKPFMKGKPQGHGRGPGSGMAK